MRKALITLFFTFSSCLAVADERALEATDGLVGEKASDHTLVCQAAMASKDAAKSQAVSLKIGRRELSRIRCNDMTVMDFARLHSADTQQWSIATVQ